MNRKIAKEIRRSIQGSHHFTLSISVRQDKDLVAGAGMALIAIFADRIIHP